MRTIKVMGRNTGQSGGRGAGAWHQVSALLAAGAFVLTAAAGCGPSPTAGGPAVDGDKRPETQPVRRAAPSWDPEPVGQIIIHRDGMALVDCGKAKGVKRGDSLVVHREGRFVAILRIHMVEAQQSAGLAHDIRMPVKIGDKVSRPQTRARQPVRPPRLLLLEPEGKIVSIKNGIAVLNVGWDDGLKPGAVG